MAVAIHASPENITRYFMLKGSEWVLWDGEISSLSSIKQVASLSSVEAIQLYQGKLSGLEGTLRIYGGYRIDNTKLVYQNKPLIIQSTPLNSGFISWHFQFH